MPLRRPTAPRNTSNTSLERQLGDVAARGGSIPSPASRGPLATGRRRPGPRGAAAAVAGLAAALGAPGAPATCPDATAATFYQEHVRPIFLEHCAACHSQDGAESNLALDSYAAALAGGASGAVLRDGDPASSRLWRLVAHEETPAMPPNQDRLPAEQLAVIRAWIEGGLLEQAAAPPVPRRPRVPQYAPSTDHRPRGEPAMPRDVSRQPVTFAAVAGAVDAVATSPWAPLAAVGGQRQIALYHVETGALLGVLPMLEGAPRVVRFSRDGSLLVAAGGRPGASGSAVLFDVASGRRLAAFGDELDEVLAADLSPDQRLAALGGPKRTVRVFRVADGSVAYQLKKHADWVTAVEFSPDGKLLATADRAGAILLWDAAAGHPRGELRGHAGEVTALSWRADSAQLASAGEDATVRLWDAKGAALKSFVAHAGGALDVQYARDGRLATCGRDQQAKLWQVDGSPLRTAAQTADVALACAISHDGSRIVVADWTGEVRVVASETGEAAATLAANPPSLEMRLADAQRGAREARQHAEQARQQLAAARAPLEAARAAHAEQARQRVASEEVLRASLGQRAALADAASAAATAWQDALAAAAAALERLAACERAALEAVAAERGLRQAECDEARQALAAAERQAAAAVARLAEAQREATAAGEAAAQQQRQLTVLREQQGALPPIEPLEAAASEAADAAAQAEARLAEAEQAEQHAAREQAEFSAAAAALEAAAAEAQAARDQARQRARAAEAHRRRLAADLDDRRAALAQIDGRLAELAVQRDEAAADCAQAEEQLASQQADLERQQAAAAAADAAAADAESRRAAHQAAEAFRAAGRRDGSY